MPNIDDKLRAISSAVYGDEVRGAIREALEEMNTSIDNVVVGDFFDKSPFNSEANAAALKNAIYRGKNLGSTFTSTQLDEIQNGTFHDLFLGDYWISSMGCLLEIVGFDFFLTSNNDHHIVVAPKRNVYDIGPYLSLDDMYSEDNFWFYKDGPLYNAMNGLYGTTYAREDFKNLFGEDHLLEHHINVPMGYYSYDSLLPPAGYLDSSGIFSTLSIPSISHLIDSAFLVINAYDIINAGNNLGTYNNRIFPAYRFTKEHLNTQYNAKWLVLEMSYINDYIYEYNSSFGFLENTTRGPYWGGLGYSKYGVLIKPFATIG